MARFAPPRNRTAVIGARRAEFDVINETGFIA